MSVSASVIEIRKTNPCATLQTISDKVGVTSERVRQILKKNELPTRRWRQTYLCIVCGKEIVVHYRKSYHSPFCSNECNYEYHHIILMCHKCGKSFSRRVSDFLSYPSRSNSIKVYTFCSRECYHQWRREG